MSKILYCLECGHALHSQPVVTDSTDFTVTTSNLSYCLNDDCKRWGLFCWGGLTKQPKKTKRKRKPKAQKQ